MGGILASAGYPQAALRLLRKAVLGNYLCVPAMDNDPLFDSVRKDPEFAATHPRGGRPPPPERIHRSAGDRPLAEAKP